MTASPAIPSGHGLRMTFPTTLFTILAAFAAVAPLAADIYLPAFVQMAGGLGVSASNVQLTMTTFLAGVALGQLGIEVLSDHISRRLPLLWSSMLTLAANTDAVLPPSLPVLLVARFFQGLGSVVGIVLGQVITPNRSHGITAARTLSIVMAVQGIALTVASIPGGVFVELIGWRGILGIIAAFTGLLVVTVPLWVLESLSIGQRHDGGLRMLLGGIREPAHSHVLVRLLLINTLSFGLLMTCLSTAPFVLRNTLGMGAVAYTAVSGLCKAMMMVTIAVAASFVYRFSRAHQVRIGSIAGLVADAVFAEIHLT